MTTWNGTSSTIFPPHVVIGRAVSNSFSGLSAANLYYGYAAYFGEEQYGDVLEFGAIAAATTAPAISAPTDDASSDTTAIGGLTTDQAHGTLYGVITQSATTPSIAQIKAGQDHLGAAADAAASGTVSDLAPSLAFTGLTASTAYFAHFIHTNGNNVDAAAAVSGDGFTTNAEGGDGQSLRSMRVMARNPRPRGN